MTQLWVAILALSIIKFNGQTPIYSQALGLDPVARAHKLSDGITDAANSWGVKPSVYASLVFHESGFWVNARSKRGALGLAQLMPATRIGREWRRLCVYRPQDCNDWWNLWNGAKALSQFQRKCRFIAPALGAYRRGDCVVGPRTHQVLDTHRWIERCIAANTDAACQNSKWLAMHIRKGRRR